MVYEKPVEQSEVVDSGLILAKSVGKSKVASENKISSDSTSSNQCAASSSEGYRDSVVGVDVYNPTSSCYNYNYPGCNGSFGQLDDGKDNSSVGVQTNHNSIAYYMPGYNPYAQDFNYSGDPSTVSNSTSGNVKSSPNRTTRMRSNGIKPSELYSNLSKLSSIHSNSKSCSFTPPNVMKPKVDTQQNKPLNKSGSYYRPAGYSNVYKSPVNYQSSSSSHNRSVFGNAGPAPKGYRSNSMSWNGNDTMRPIRKNEFELASEVTRGPRVNKKSISDSSEKESVGPTGQKREKYNLAEFQTEYESAKFYVIKSYSEDDVHKCLMYGVWSSTPNGNKKLEAAFLDAELKANEMGVKCPIFLFFSVNGSGQFLGVAEMLGKVDFNKDMDFWQIDKKWSGFFPVKWHIVKDIPNSQLRHILLENNDNRPVTFTRDTQEIGLKQGVEMLNIFKNYESRTSLLDDLEFYEARERALHMKCMSKPGPKHTIFMNGYLPKQLENEDEDGAEKNNSDMVSLVDLTNKLSVASDS